MLLTLKTEHFVLNPLNSDPLMSTDLSPGNHAVHYTGKYNSHMGVCTCTEWPVYQLLRFKGLMYLSEEEASYVHEVYYKCLTGTFEI